MTKRYIGYFRVSSQRQGIFGLGLEAQQEQVRKFADQDGAELLEEYIEIESGKISDRPVLAEAMEACRRAKATLVIAKLDRLARNVAFVSRLLERRIEFKACDMPHADRTTLQMMAVFGELESRLISERTKAALAAAKARGVELGKNGKILGAEHRQVATAFAQTMVAPISDARRSGASSCTSIADWLNRAGIASRGGGSWHATSVSRLIRRLEPLAGPVGVG
jgi:DNA invertase Pin-like site-specific DNA recombinase